MDSKPQNISIAVAAAAVAAAVDDVADAESGPTDETGPTDYVTTKWLFLMRKQSFCRMQILELKLFMLKHLVEGISFGV